MIRSKRSSGFRHPFPGPGLALPRVENALHLALYLVVFDAFAVDDAVGAVFAERFVTAEALHDAHFGAEHVAEPVTDRQEASHVALAERLVEHLEGFVDQRVPVASPEAHAQRADELREAKTRALHLTEQRAVVDPHRGRSAGDAQTDPRQDLERAALQHVEEVVDPELAGGVGERESREALQPVAVGRVGGAEVPLEVLVGDQVQEPVDLFLLRLRPDLRPGRPLASRT